jgi:hypothetical protein
MREEEEEQVRGAAAAAVVVVVVGGLVVVPAPPRWATRARMDSPFVCRRWLTGGTTTESGGAGLLIVLTLSSRRERNTLSRCGGVSCAVPPSLPFPPWADADGGEA